MTPAISDRTQWQRTRIKVCGITCMEDAREAIACGADALGFIFVQESPRYVGHRMSEVEDIVEKLGPFVSTVAVVRRLADARELPVGLFSAVQYYEGEDSYEWVPRSTKLMLAVRGAVLEPAGTSLRGVCALLIDAYEPDRLGGTGTTADWAAARALRLRVPVPVVLAGGLTHENVGDAIRIVRPYAVDVSSGVEASPGRKDPTKLRKFVEAVNQADKITCVAREEVGEA